MRTLEVVRPLVETETGVVTSPSHRILGLPVTPPGKVMEQVRRTVPPAMTEEEEEVREIVASSVERQIDVNSGSLPCSCITYMDSLCWGQSTW